MYLLAQNSMRKLFLLPLLIAFAFFVSKFPSYAAPIGNYLVLNGGYVKVNSADSSSPTSFVFDTWIRLANMSSYPTQIILSIGDKNTGKLHYEISSTINRQINLSYYHGTGGYTSISAGEVFEDQWNHLRVEINSSSAKLFINDSLIFSPTLTNGTLRPIGPNIVVGNSYKESFFDAKPFKGFIDEVSIESGGSTVLSWHLDEARGAGIAADSSGNNKNGTLNGGDNLIHFFGVLPSPTPWQFGLPPIQWTRPVLPTLSFPFPFPSNPTPTGSLNPPPGNNPTPTSGIRDLPRRAGR